MQQWTWPKGHMFVSLFLVFILHDKLSRSVAFAKYCNRLVPKVFSSSEFFSSVATSLTETKGSSLMN